MYSINLCTKLGLTRCLFPMDGERTLRKFFLTFDIEDFISKNSILALKRILESLKKYDLKALFFITGNMAEKLRNFPIIVDMLNEHQIGYHSSSHSVHPTIFEFTDVKDYKEAYRISLQRETSHVNPLTGKIEGKGGIYALKALFPKKQIASFRAPGNCWSPPHLEALKSLGIPYDFSTNVSSVPVNYKGITFYPYPIIAHWQGKLSEYFTLLVSLLKCKTTVIGLHPNLLVNQHEWDSIYWNYNPKKLIQPPVRSSQEVVSLLRKLDLLLKHIRNLQEIDLIELTPNLKKSYKNLLVTKTNVKRWYQTSIGWAIKQKYKPRFLYRHFLKFFKMNSDD